MLDARESLPKDTGEGFGIAGVASVLFLTHERFSYISLIVVVGEEIDRSRST